MCSLNSEAVPLCHSELLWGFIQMPWSGQKFWPIQSIPRNNNAGAGEGTQKVKEFVEQARAPKFSLSKLAKQSVITCIPVTPSLERTETGGLLRCSDHQPSSHFNERPCLKRISCKMTEQDTWCHPLASACSQVCTYTAQTCTPLTRIHAHRKKNGNENINL